jgi:hypothetical protein
MAATAEKDQHEPQLPWFLIALTAPDVLQSIELETAPLSI